MDEEALVLVAHGARDPQWAAPSGRIAERLRKAGIRVETAFLEFLTPDLETAVATLAAEGINRIVLVPVFIAAGGHVQRDLPMRLQALQQRFVGIRLELVSAVGEAEPVIAAMATVAAAALKQK